MRSRGQTLIETAAFLPLMLLAMFAIIYFSQQGVLQGRTAQAARYATLMTNAGANVAGSSGVYSFEQMYAELHREGNNATNPGFPSLATGCASSANGQTSDEATAITQNEPFTSSHATNYFSPNAGTSGTDSSCATYRLDLTATSAGAATNYYTAQFTTAAADNNLPPLASTFTGGGSTSHVTAGMAYPQPANPVDMMYCNPTYANVVATGLGPLEPVTNAGPYAGYRMPAPTVPHIC